MGDGAQALVANMKDAAQYTMFYRKPSLGSNMVWQCTLFKTNYSTFFYPYLCFFFILHANTSSPSLPPHLLSPTSPHPTPQPLLRGSDYPTFLILLSNCMTCRNSDANPFVENETELTLLCKMYPKRKHYPFFRRKSTHISLIL